MAFRFCAAYLALFVVHGACVIDLCKALARASSRQAFSQSGQNMDIDWTWGMLLVLLYALSRAPLSLSRFSS